MASASTIKFGDVARLVRATAAVFYVEETMYLRNNLEGKLSNIGVRVKKAAPSQSVTSLDLSTVDIVIAIDGALTLGLKKSFRERAAAAGKRSFILSHRTSDDSWNILRSYLEDRAPTSARPAPVVSLDVVHRDDEQLAAIYAAENEALKKQLEEVRKEDAIRAAWKVEREKLIESEATAIRERKQATREAEGLRSDFQDRLANAEARLRDSKKEVDRAKADAEKWKAAAGSNEASEKHMKLVTDQRDQLAREVQDLKVQKQSIADVLSETRTRLSEANEQLAKSKDVLSTVVRERGNLSAQLTEATERLKKAPQDLAPVVRKLRAIADAAEAGVITAEEAQRKMRAALEAVKS